MEFRNVLLVFMTLTLAATVESKKNDKRKFRDKVSSTGAFIDNICDNLDRDSKVHCYCIEPALKSATKAECWVFNGGLEFNDDLWTAFKTQPYIERLIFNVRADGALTFVPANVLKHMSRLQYLRIQYASIDVLNKHAFGNCSTLKEIVMIRDKITLLEKFSVAHMKSLQNITFANNRITEVPRNVFYDLPNIRFMSLSSNNISIIHEGSFEHLNSLVDLKLDENSISVLTKETFKGLANLKRLDMRSNRINMVGDLTFSELWNLQDLLLDNNNLMFITERAFDGLSQLKKLTMTSNKLQTIDEGLLEGVRSLVLLDLRNNQLDSMTYETIKPIVDNMKESPSVIYLDGNKLSCDCRLSWIYALRNETKSEQLKESLEDVSCIPDTVLNNRLDHLALETTVKTHLRSESYYENEYSDDSEGFVSENDSENSQRSERVMQKRVINIPVEMLPCPNNLIYPSDSYGPPSQDEVKYYGNAIASATRLSIAFVQMLPAMLILMR